MASLIDTDSIAVWAEGNIGDEAALRQRIVLPGGLYPELFGTGAPKINYAAGVIYDPASINPDTGVAYNLNPADAADEGHGWIGYAPVAGDTDTPGTYVYRWRIVFPSGAQVSFPNKDWKRVDVVAETDDPAPYPDT